MFTLTIFVLSNYYLNVIVQSQIMKFLKLVMSKFIPISAFSVIHNTISSILLYSSPSELTKLGEEFVDYQLLRDEDIPAYVWNDAEPHEEGGSVHYRMGTLWHYLSTLMSRDGYQRFKKLCRIAKLVLVIPHSNADDECSPW